MEALGHSPSKQELIEMIKLVDLDKSRTIDFKEFLALMALRLKQPFAADEVIAAFAVRRGARVRTWRRARGSQGAARPPQEFDEEESGFIHVDTLRNMMTEILPHAMEETEIEEMVRTAQPDEEGMIDYRAFVGHMFNV